jgi:phosphatidate cytidylyltransferase
VHLKRWITSLIALPFLIAVVYQGGIFFAGLVSAAMLCALHEYFRIIPDADREKTEPNGSIDSLQQTNVQTHRTPSKSTGFNYFTIWGYLMGLVVIFATYWGNSALMISSVAISFIGAAGLWLGRFEAHSKALDRLLKHILAIVYIPLSLSFLVLIRNSSDGMLWIFSVLAIIFAGDISAYYVGSTWGRHKLSPTISPGKTVEGAIAGLAANILTGSVIKFIFFPGPAWIPCIFFFLAVGIAGQIGDLFESGLKRASNIKDSGSILPGHGGLLDRIDALIFASPVAYVFKSLL